MNLEHSTGLTLRGLVVPSCSQGHFHWKSRSSVLSEALGFELSLQIHMLNDLTAAQLVFAYLWQPGDSGY